MHLTTVKLALLSVVLLSACADLPARPTNTGEPLVVLRGVRVIDGEGGPPLVDQCIVIEGDHIREVGPRTSLEVPTSARIVELAGKHVFPGLISNHAHVGMTEGTASGAGHYTRENVRRQLHQYAAYGVTTVTSLGYNPTLFYDLQKEVAGLPYADLFGADRGIGVPDAGPPVNLGPDQLYRPASVAEARARVREMASRKPALIKIWVDDWNGTLPHKMSPEVYKAVIDEAHRAGLRVAAHVYYLEDARRLVELGVDVLAHSVRDQLVDDSLVHEMRRKRVWYVPTLDLDESGYIYATQPEWTKSDFFHHALQPEVQLQLSDPSWRQQVLADRAKVELEVQAEGNGLKNLKRIFDGSVPVGFGADSGVTPLRVIGFAEHRELELMVKAGLTPMQALRCATHDAAALLDLRDRGTIAPGMLADLVVVDGQPDQNILDTRRIVSVWKRGHELGPIEAFQP